MKLVDVEQIYCSDCEHKGHCENVTCDIKTMPTVDPVVSAGGATAGSASIITLERVGATNYHIFRPRTGNLVLRLRVRTGRCSKKTTIVL